MLALAKEHNPTAGFQLMDALDISSIGQKFDGIICGFCLPYLSLQEAEQLISDAASILLPGGVLYLSTMEDDYSKSGLKTASSGDQLQAYYHSADHLTQALLQNGFHIIDLQRKEYPAPDGSPVTDLIIIAAI